MHAPPIRATLGFLSLALIALGGVDRAVAAGAEELAPRRVYLRIAAGPLSGSDFALGAAMARILSQPAIAEGCEAAGCGAAGVTAVASASEGALANLRLVAHGDVETGLVPADLAAEAYHGTGAFAGAPPVKSLRAIASLFPAPIQLVVAREAQIAAVRDLRGKRVGIDARGSETNAEARRLLTAFGLGPNAVRTAEINVDEAVERLGSGKLDALFVVGAAPSAALNGLLRSGAVLLLPITGAVADRLVARSAGALVPLAIAPSAYGLPNPVTTLGVETLWVVRASADAGLVEALCRALFAEGNRTGLAAAYSAGALIGPAHALDGVSLPLHPGAERCYQDLSRSGSTGALTSRPHAAPPMPHSRPATPEGGEGPK